MGGPGVLAAKNTGSHCAGGTATGWLVCASLLATLDFVCGRKAVRKAAATPMSTSTRKLEASFLSYKLRWGGGSRQGEGEGLGRRRSGQGTHTEHARHGCDARRVEVSGWLAMSVTTSKKQLESQQHSERKKTAWTGNSQALKCQSKRVKSGDPGAVTRDKVRRTKL